MSHHLDYVVLCEGDRIDVRVDLEDARKAARAASLDAARHGAIATIERSGRIVECWSAGSIRNLRRSPGETFRRVSP
jgi:hypothetical protein